jgi:hypothetical protein
VKWKKLRTFIEPDGFGSKICLAKVLATINFGIHLVGIQKGSPIHKVLAKILAKNSCQYFDLP